MKNIQIKIIKTTIIKVKKEKINNMYVLNIINKNNS